MQEQESGKSASLLIREGANLSNVLRIKSSVLISEQGDGLISIPLPGSTDKLPKEIGSLAEILVKSAANTVPRLQMISLRSYQVILNLGVGNIWTEEEEVKIKELIDSLLRARGLAAKWSAQRKIGQKPKPL